MSLIERYKLIVSLINLMREYLPVLLVITLLFGCTANQPNSGVKVYENNSTTFVNQTTIEPPIQIQNNSSSSQTNNITNQTNTTNSTQTNSSMKVTYPLQPPVYNFSNVTTSDGRLIVYYFFNSHCGACAAIRPQIDRLESIYTNVDWQEYDLATENGSWAYVEFADQYNLTLKQRLIPQVLVNGTILTDRYSINSTLGDLIWNITGPSVSKGLTS